MAIVKCPNCPGDAYDDRFHTLRLPMLNDANEPVVDAAGAPRHVYLRLPQHVNPHYFTPLDATGLQPAACDHGLQVHPDPAVQADTALSHRGKSWVRGRYLNAAGRCPVCRDQPRPDDLTSGFTDPQLAAAAPTAAA